MTPDQLFDIADLRQPLTDAEKKSLVNDLIHQAKIGVKYMYSVREAAGLMHISYDEILELIKAYKLDGCFFLAVLRVPWWSICEYLLDDDDTLDRMYWKYLDMAEKIKRAPFKRLYDCIDRRTPLDVEIEDEIRQRLKEQHTIEYLPCVNSLLTLDEVSFILDISPASVDRLVKSRAFPVVDVPEEPLQILKSDLVEYILKSFVAERPIDLPDFKVNIVQKSPKKTA